MICDLYVLGVEADCPGIAAHCARDEHCTDTDAFCAGERSLDDHPSRCCFCERLG